MIGPEAPIIIPKVVQPVEKHIPDYEVELTVVIGKAARDVSEADALDYVLAYTAANDVSLVSTHELLTSILTSGIDLFQIPPNGGIPVVLLERIR